MSSWSRLSTGCSAAALISCGRVPTTLTIRIAGAPLRRSGGPAPRGRVDADPDVPDRGRKVNGANAVAAVEQNPQLREEREVDGPPQRIAGLGDDGAERGALPPQVRSGSVAGDLVPRYQRVVAVDQCAAVC